MGEVKQQAGLLFEYDNFLVVKKIGVAGDKIAKHNHPEYDILFTVLMGTIKVYINENEIYTLQAGQVLHFDGENYIQADFVTDAEAQVTLIKK